MNTFNKLSNGEKIKEINEQEIESNLSGLTKQLAEILIKEKENIEEAERYIKVKRILTLLAKGAALALIIAAPQTARLFKGFAKNKPEWNEWKLFNQQYLMRAIKNLEKQKLVEYEIEGDQQVVKITEQGRKKVLKYALREITLSRPSYWDGKWRLIFYDVLHKKNSVRQRFQAYLRSLGFYPLQKSVYLHAWPCEKEIEFLRSYLGISGEVRVVIADHIENDGLFREYFALRK